MNSSDEKDNCQHEGYCNFSNNICIETDFKDKCHMKDTDIDKMHLLKSVKERVERDEKRLEKNRS